MTVVWGILGLGVLVFWHELGHYVAARLCGVKVVAFSVGMGPVIFHRTVTRGDNSTDWRLSLIPFGGYCAMKGEDDFAAALESGQKEIPGGPDSFYGTHPLRRVIIAFAGPLFNLILAFIALMIIGLSGYTYLSAGTSVIMADEIYEGMESPAHNAGMRTGDKILAMDGRPALDFSDIAEYVSSRPEKDIVFTVERADAEYTGSEGIIHGADSSPSSEAQDPAKILYITVRPALDKETATGKIGIVSSPDSVEERMVPGKGIFGSARYAAERIAQFVTLTFRSIGILFKGVRITSAVSGPARIATMLGEAVSMGFSGGIKNGIVSTLDFLSLISLALFISNLLPIPVLDGGQIIFSLAEAVSRRRLSPKFLYRIKIAGLIIVGSLAVLAISGDLLYFIKR